MEKKTNGNNFFDTPMIPDTQYMKADIYEDKTKYNIDIDLPGFKKSNIKVMYENGYLMINAIKEEIKEIKDNYIRRERFYGEVKRSFYIGEKNESDIKATYKDGILNISFSKEENNKKNSKIIYIE